MKEARHMILRFPEERKGPVSHRVRAGTRSSDIARPAGIEVGVIGRREAAALKRDRTVAAVAVAMPMKLIEPAADLGPPVETLEKVAWGVKAIGADTCTFTGSGTVVAVLDTGIDHEHPAFTEEGLEVVRRNFTQDSDDDRNGHGTHCAGTIFGRPVGGMRIGVAPGVTKALIGKVIGRAGADSTSVAEAIMWASSNGAHVISVSLGIDFPGYVKQLIDIDSLPADLATSRALEGYRANVMLFERLASFLRAQEALIRHPCIVIAAAGNESQRDVNSEYDIGVAPPAVSEGMISVAALGQGPAGYTVAPFSNTGATVAGPGVAIVSAKHGGGLTSMSGTSMATPHVAGIAALWVEKLRRSGSLSLERLHAMLIASCVNTGMAPGFDPADVGAGMVQAPPEN